jgi:catechol 2,3-dioxygenase-like lactoylglutathione lyase family enzyme
MDFTIHHTAISVRDMSESIRFYSSSTIFSRCSGIAIRIPPLTAPPSLRLICHESGLNT